MPTRRQSPAEEGSGLIGALLPLILFLGIFWFLLLRPQQKRQKEHKTMVQALKKGDEVVTNGGLLGKVTKVGDAFVSIEIAQGQEVNIQRGGHPVPDAQGHHQVFMRHRAPVC